MQQIEDVRARLQAANGTAERLGAAWGAFTLLLDTCEAAASQSSGLFAAFAFAAAAASRGRLMLESAPSLPPGVGTHASHGTAVMHDLEQTARALAGLATALRDTLAQAAAEAVHAGDRAACQDAVAEAVQVAGLLSSDG